MQSNEFNLGLCDFLAASPTPFHAVRAMVQQLDAAGYQWLDESVSWSPVAGGKYYVVRNGSSLIAWRMGCIDLQAAGMRMVGAHTDSPCLKVKPQPEIHCQGYMQLGVEVYGGALLNPWFDRDLSLAGRVVYLDQAGTMVSALLDMRRPVAVIPSLAIHLDRDVNNQRSINAQNHLPPILMRLPEGEPTNFRELLQAELGAQGRGVAQVLDYELALYDVQPPALVGWNEEFIAGARLDNLLSCYVGLQSLLLAESEQPCMLICTDHEEVGSTSACGANGPFLRSVLDRLCGDAVAVAQLMERSLMISADNAHGVHPNYADKHDAQHGPVLNRGPVIKHNANQRYATTSETAAWVRHLAAQAGVTVQDFVVRSDMGCGSTIGPITASEVGVRTVDIGVPTFAMHSIRELAGSEDAIALAALMQAFFSQPGFAIKSTDC